MHIETCLLLLLLLQLASYKVCNFIVYIYHCMLWLFKINFRGFCRFLMHGNSSYVVLCTQCLRCNICSAWFLDIRISTCSVGNLFLGGLMKPAI